MATFLIDLCPICEGTGYLLDQTYLTADLPDGAVAVQRCDECLRWAEDEDAAEAAFLDGHGTAWGFSFDVLVEIPGFDPANPWGEYWIIPTKEDR